VLILKLVMRHLLRLSVPKFGMDWSKVSDKWRQLFVQASRSYRFTIPE
jgi:hypothetical protein